jgi:hypothetical protein
VNPARKQKEEPDKEKKGQVHFWYLYWSINYFNLSQALAGTTLAGVQTLLLQLQMKKLPRLNHDLIGKISWRSY